MNELKKADRRIPYQLSEERFEAMHEQIRRSTEGKSRKHTLGRIYLAAAVAAAALIGAGVFLMEYHTPTAPTPDLEQMLSTAPTETIQQAAEENYDAIIYNQQL